MYEELFQKLASKCGLETEVTLSEDEVQALGLDALRKAGEPLPKGISCSDIYMDGNAEHVEYTRDLFSVCSEEQILRLVALKKARDIRIIRNCVLFFTTLAVLSLLGILLF